MKQYLFQEKYPVYTLEIAKDETSLKGVDAIIEYLKGKVEDHPAASTIAIFDHYSHTKSLEGGEVTPEIIDAKNLVFCFGMILPNPEIMAVRPRNIGVTETNSGYIINFLEAPVLPANETMEDWVKSIVEI